MKMTENEKKIFYSKLGENIRQERMRKNVSQEYLAKILQLSRPSIVNIEKARQYPPLHLVVEISNALETSIYELIPTQYTSTDKASLDNYDKKINIYQTYLQPENPNEFKDSVKEFLKKNLEK